MADQFGYTKISTDRPETWIADGYVSVGATGAPSFSTVPSGVVAAVTRTGVGAYSISLQQPWYALLFANVVSEIPLGLSPATVACQLVSDDVGVSATPKVLVQFNVAGSATELPNGSGFRFLLLLKNSSA